MTKLKEKVCDYCGFKWEDVSPPSKESYDAGRIHVGDGSLGGVSFLIPTRIVAIRHREGVSDSHAGEINDKDFCTPACFIAYIMREIYDPTSRW